MTTRSDQSSVQQPLQLGCVQETLLIPLYMRARETRRAEGIIRDSKAVEIVDSLAYDFSKFDSAWRLQLDVAIRTEIFDQLVRDFLLRHPDGLVVNLGAGLDGRFERLDNGRVTWVDLDLPDSMALRRRFFHESSRNPFLADSALDYGWFDRLPATRDRTTMVVAEGLFCYFEPEQVRALFDELARRLPSGELVFQSISPEYVNQQQAVPGLNKTQAVFKWGLRRGEEIESWNPRFEFAGEWAFIDRYPRRWGWLRWACLLPPVYERVRGVMKITRIILRPQ